MMGDTPRRTAVNPIRIRKTLDSATVHLPELEPLIGRTVEFIVLDDTPAFRQLETRETFLGLAPPDPTPEQHAANMTELRRTATTDLVSAAWLELIEGDGLDVAAIIQARGME